MGSTFRCFYCRLYLSDVSQLLAHTSSHVITDIDAILKNYLPKGKRTLQVDVSDLKCRFCNEKFGNLSLVRKHLETEHGIDFFKASNGMTEYILKSDGGLFKCHLCYEEFRNFSHLNVHMNAHISKVVCETCGAGFLNQHLLLKHKESHWTNKISCSFCDKRFTKRSQLKYHTAIVHKGRDRAKPNKCPHCTDTFKEHYKKMLHLKQVHGITKDFPCHLCKSNFKTRRAVTEHFNKCHTQKFKCDICAKCFSIESKLRSHMLSHSGERCHVCSVCKNAYMHKITLKKHMRTHDRDSTTDYNSGLT